MKKNPDARQDAQKKDAEESVAFPGGIPKRWLNPAATIFILVSPLYTAWVVIEKVWRGVTDEVPAVDIAGAIWTHLSEFLFGFPVLILISCKILERIMYYLDVKKLVADYRQRLDNMELRADKAEQLADEAIRHADEAERLADEAIRRAVEAERRADEAEQRAEAYQQSAENYRQSAEDYRQSAETYRQLAAETDAEKDSRA